MAHGALVDVLGHHLHPDLHRSAPGVVHRGEEGHQFADMDRLAEDHLIHRQGHHVASGVALGAGEGHFVEELEQRAAVDVAGEVRLVGGHEHAHGQLVAARFHRSPITQVGHGPLQWAGGRSAAASGDRVGRNAGAISTAVDNGVFRETGLRRRSVCARASRGSRRVLPGWHPSSAALLRRTPAARYAPPGVPGRGWSAGPALLPCASAR